MCRHIHGMVCYMILYVERYLSNAASFVFYVVACLTRLIQFAALFTTFEESLR